MKARRLKQILNNTGYTVAFYGKYIGIGSPLCHDLIKLDIETRKITYALDTFHKGRSSLGNDELKFIWDRLHELVANDGIADILNGNDVIDKPLPVYTVRDGSLLCTVTDAYGWPNVTVEGYMMHDNNYFQTVAEAIEYGIEQHEHRVSNLSERLKELQSECSRIEFLIQDCKNIITGLKLLNPPADSPALNTMNNFDPGTRQPDELKGDEAAGLKAAPADTANEQATEEGEKTEG